MQPFISTLGAEVIVTPGDYWQHIRSSQKGDWESPELPGTLAIRVDHRFDEQGQCIGVSGLITHGPEFLRGLIASCFARFYHEAWDTTDSTYCNLRIAPTRARRHTRFSPQVIQGSSCQGYPQYSGVGEIYVAQRPLPQPVMIQPAIR